MNISKLNPIGYETKTEKGNTYKKSNKAKTGFIAGVALLNTAPLLLKKNTTSRRIAEAFTSKEAILGLAELFKIKISPKMIIPLTAAGIALDLVFGYCIGQSIDNSINNKRIAKADQLAETQNTNKS